MNTNVSYVKKNGISLSGLEIQVPTPAGAFRIAIAEFVDNTVTEDDRNFDNPEFVDSTSRMACGLLTILSSQFTETLKVFEAQNSERRQHEEKMLLLQQQHQMQLLKLQDELDAAKHSRIQANRPNRL